MKDGNLKSRSQERELSEFCLGLSLNLLKDVSTHNGVDSSRDLETLYIRVMSEGLPFLTKTLPRFQKAIISALETGQLLVPDGFSRQKGTQLPKFLGGLMRLVFSDDGKLLTDYSVSALTDLCQFCSTWYKLELPFEDITEVIDSFVHTDNVLPESFDHLGDPDVRLESQVLTVAQELLYKLLKKLDLRTIKPRHGPGAVATGEKSHEKMRFKRVYSSVDRLYHSSHYYFLSDSMLFDTFDNYALLEELDHGTSKVILVPKDSRGPRIISAEPLELQFFQQGISSKLVELIESHELTAGHVNFTDQGVNRRLALEGSSTGAWGTIDLSAASDRVSVALFKALFHGTPLYEPALATRSKYAQLPDRDGLLELKKFAPMGSALCFPVEALVFWSLSVALMHVHHDLAINKAISVVYVYGDDIIIDHKYFDTIVDNLRFYGLKVNADKSFNKGEFRESCGVDAVRGVAMMLTKIKTSPPCKFTDADKLVSYIDTSNRLFARCYYRSARYLQLRVEAILGKLPISNRDPFCVHHEEDKLPGTLSFVDAIPAWYTRGRATYSVQVPRRRYNPALQRYEFLVPSFKSPRMDTGDRGWSELYRHFIYDLGTRPGLYSKRRRLSTYRRWLPLWGGETARSVS